MSALWITLGSLGLILVLTRVRVPLFASILAGAVCVGVLFRLEASELLQAAGAALVQPRTIALMIVVTSLIALMGTLQASGQMERIVALVQMLLRRPVLTMAALPALIGLLPMPGGALFSAPMVESAAGGEKVRAGKLSAINYWFRHGWEYWWPLYPGVILAVTLTGMTFGAFIAYQAGMSVFMFSAGLLILRGTHPNLHVIAPPAPRGTKRKLVWATSSIWVILLVWGAVKLLLLWAPRPLSFLGAEGIEKTLCTYLPIMLGLVVSLICTIRLNRMSAAAVRGALTNRRIYEMAALILSVMVYQYMLERVEAPRQIGGELMRMGVPVLAVLALLPFVAGFVTGLAVGFVGTAFPIVLGLIAAMDDPGPIGPYVVLAYGFGHLGQMLSPLHLCHVMSNKYFKTRFTAVYREILPAAVLTGASVVTYFYALRWLVN